MFLDTVFNNVLGYIGGKAVAEHNNALAAEREKEARRENYMYNESAAENADRRTRALFKDFYSMPAQMMQLKEAGLSPSIYSGGISGMTGAQGAQGEGANGVSPEIFGVPSPKFNFDAIAAKEALSRARLNNAQADELEGNNAMGEAKVENIWSQINNLVADTELKGVQKYMYQAELYSKNLDNEIKTITKADEIRKVAADADKAEHAAKEALFSAGKAEIDWTIADETIQAQMDGIKADTANKVANCLKTLKQTELTEAEIKQIENDIAIKWDELHTEQSNAGTYAIAVENQQEYWKNYLKIKAKELGIREDELEVEKNRMVIDAATTIIGIGADLGGTYMMTQTYDRRTLMQGKDVITDKQRYDAKRRVTGGTYTKKGRR